MKIIRLKFQSFEDPDTLARCVEAKAVDPETDTPIASYSLTMMAAWLKRNGYSWQTGSNGLWERAA